MKNDNLERKLIENYFVELFPEQLTVEEGFHLLLLVLDMKNSVLVMSVDSEEEELLEDFCKDFNLEIKSVEGSERSLIDKLLGRDTRFFKNEVFVTKNNELFEIIDDEETDDKSIGIFLEYPEEAIEFYSQTEVPARDFKKRKPENIQGIEYLKLVGYVPPPKEESIEAAINEGKKREKAIEKLENQTGLPLKSIYTKPLKNFKESKNE